MPSPTDNAGFEIEGLKDEAGREGPDGAHESVVEVRIGFGGVIG